jgi:putative membrane protein
MTAARQQRLPVWLLAGYLLLFAGLAVRPYARDVWWVENLTILPVVVVLVGLYAAGMRFSNTAYVLMSCLIYLHTIGGHYTFERVPFGFVTHLFGFERNHYDRLAHFTVGFYAYPVVELLLGRRWVTKPVVAYLFGLFAIAGLAAFYEIFEWQYAVCSDAAAGLAVLGSQGDIWDAQKDMLADSLGAVAGVGLYIVLHRRRGGGQRPGAPDEAGTGR